MVDQALEEKLDRARAARCWADVAKLAALLEERATARRAREAAGVVDIAARRGRR